MNDTLSLAAASIVEVGKGRGFVVAARDERRLVITAAHCLPDVPPAGPWATDHRYRHLLAPLGGAPTVWAELLFVDPVADLAVLGEPDGQVLPDECDGYTALVDACSELPIGVVTSRCAAWLLTLDGQWEPCEVQVNAYGAATSLTIVGGTAGNRPGNSGSPIVSEEGRALGVVVLGAEQNGIPHYEQHGQPLLVSRLPVWLLHEFNVDLPGLQQFLESRDGDAAREVNEIFGKGGPDG